MASRFGILISIRKWIVVGIILSLTVHLVVFGGYLLLGQRVREVVHRITFEPPPPPSVFVKPPRLTARVLEFRKQPIPRGFYLQQKGTMVRARVAEVQAIAAIRTDAMLRQLNPGAVTPPSLRPGSRFGVGGGDVVQDVGMAGEFGLALPVLSAVEVRGVKETRQQVDMKLDMLSVENMDTGEYQAMVIQDPGDRKKIKGYIHLAQVFTRSRSAAIENAYGADLGRQYTLYASLDYLIKALDTYTGITADYIGPVAMDAPELLKVPWVFLPSWIGEAHALNEREFGNLGRYLVGGGFIVTKAGKHVFEEALRTQGLNEGAHWRLVYLKPDHPIYHAFFDFDMSVRENMFYGSLGFRAGDQGIEVGDRLAVFMPSARAGIVTDSAALGIDPASVSHDGTRSLQFAVNTVVFALTQEGSMTQQLMAGVR